MTSEASGHLPGSWMPTRRTLGLGAACAAAVGLQGCASDGQEASGDPARPKRNILGGDSRDRFQQAFERARGAPAARFADMSLRTPAGRPCSIRAAWPIEMPRKLPVIAFSPTDGATASQYDLLAGTFAAQGYFVLTPDPPPVARNATARDLAGHALTRAAEMRFVLDSVMSLRAALDMDAEAVDTERCAVAGHGEGAWTALGLIGWGRDFALSGSTMDGRARAAFALAPSFTPRPTVPSEARPLAGGRGLVAGRLDRMPAPPPGSKLLGLGIPLKSETFGGLIGAPESRRGLVREQDALAAAAAAAALLFEWAVRGENGRRDELFALNGRRVAGLDGPLSLVEA